MIIGKQAGFGARTEVEIPVVYKFFRKDKTVSWAQKQETSKFLYFCYIKLKLLFGAQKQVRYVRSTLCK